jgi:hypothetical protein
VLLAMVPLLALRSLRTSSGLGDLFR